MNANLEQILKNLVKIPTENPPGKTDEIIAYLISDVFKESDGFHNEIMNYNKKDIELKNLITRIGTGKEKIILSGHLDVVPVGEESQWKYPPFSAEVINGKMYGRGTCDMKGGLTMLIGTLLNLKKHPEFLEKYTIILIASADEEAGMTGAYNCVRKGIMKDSILLIVGEPTNMNIGIAEKGLLWADIHIYGKAGHASTPELGINSIECTLNLIPQLHKCLDNIENRVLGNSTLNIGRISGGIANNIVPEKTILSVDYRYIPEQDYMKLNENIRAIDASPCRSEVKITHTLPAIQTDTGNLFIQNLKKINGKEFIGLPYATDAGVLVQIKNPVPFVIYGPGDPGVIHKPDEYIEIGDVLKATEILSQALLHTYIGK
ncbi:MAG: M20 family metallopeptidase [Candidatus Lokiarchaeota archaeon]|nr:M20 family metallopeptidase [Candidatus Lokiarchaeota archaeon]